MNKIKEVITALSSEESTALWVRKEERALISHVQAVILKHFKDYVFLLGTVF